MAVAIDALPGISPDVAAERGYRWLDAEEALSELPALGFADWQASLGSGLLVPMYDASGNGHYQFRPDTPHVKKDGSTVKYLTPQGAKNLLDIHPRMTSYLVNPGATIVITEGVKKADAITSLGCLTCALAGVWSWRSRDDAGESHVLPEFDAIPWQGRSVVIVWDSDAAINPSVMHALRALRDELTGRGATVTTLIPPSTNGEKVGVDDLLAAGSSWSDLVPLDLSTITPLVSSAGDVAGDEFFLDRAPGVPALWGRDTQVLWPNGEPFMISALEGLGKTTDGQQLAFGLAGLAGFEELYDLPITQLPEGKVVVYLALDRPNQIARSGSRMVSPANRVLVRERVKVWKGPLPFDLVKEPERLLPWLRERNAGAVFVDSVKDVLPRLSDEEQAAAFMRAISMCIAAGIQVCLLHHNRKPNAENRKPKTLADVHGSANLTRGCGSIITLWAPAAGATEVELNHVKPPAEPVGPFVIERDHATGRSIRASSGVISADALSRRKAMILAHYREAGGAGVRRTWAELSAAGLGSTNSLRPAMSELKAEGWLMPDGGDGGRGNAVVWVMRDRTTEVL